MGKVLKDPIAPKNIKRGQIHPEGPIPVKEFKAPVYDNRTSCTVSAGDDYGIGFRTPIGMEQPRSIESGPIPQKAYAFSPDEIFYGKSAEDRKG